MAAHPGAYPNNPNVFTVQPQPYGQQGQQPIYVVQQQPQQNRDPDGCCESCIACCVCCQCCVSCCSLFTCWAQLCCAVCD
ncbi:Cysteine-rich transmembrane domain-containing protein [Caenorhabditis elegans]|uniref:Cysteine-rich transmembrane domain-containing protein n=1 Tax=Caenorhabditis elegans TaxID=6239 RepID=Q7YX36_CAEEL|nr:Cysteine-rich transmembrane CYSTM domain-containing protein [Caenorhabditis elegans]CAE17788.1 Cysteine-rich transmembrane CYSTM domain-containing protein [Caenorhabditis elegans]|eukprot:NP_001023796.1 Uncharacterized protein CELE_F14D7.11 [Caenorhabditis elegans]